MPFSKVVKNFFIWRHHHVTDQQFIYVISILVGLLSGFGAVILKNCTHYIAQIPQKLTELTFSYVSILLPMVGLVVVYFIKKWFFKGRIKYGIGTTLHAISKRKGLIAPSKIYSALITAPITVGLGGSVGLEGPTVSTGAAIGSNIGRFFRLKEKDRMLLIGCATAAAVASMFKAPITGIVFALEIFSLNLAFSSLIPLLIAATSSVITSYFFLGSDHLFYFQIADIFQIKDVGYFAGFSLIAAAFSVYFSRVYFAVFRFFNRFNTVSKIIIAGALVAFLLFLIPSFFGEGYQLINHLLRGDDVFLTHHTPFKNFIENPELLVIFLLLCILFFKVFAMSSILAAGGVGGIFVPTLVMGGVLGNLFAKLFNYVNVSNPISESNFTLVGMTGLMAGVLHAPLTAIFLIAEMTGGYELFIPLILVSTLSFIVSKYFVPHPIYAVNLIKQGAMPSHNKDQNILCKLNLEAIIEENFIVLSPDMTLGNMLKTAVAHSSRNHFPVVDKAGIFVGVLHLDDIRSMMFEQDLYELTYIRDLMHAPAAFIYYKKDSNQQVMRKFQKTGAWNLPVIFEDGTYKGFVSKSRLMTAYRNLLIRMNV